MLAALRDANDPTISTTFLDVALTTDEESPPPADNTPQQQATIVTQLVNSTTPTVDVYALHHEHVWCAQGTLQIMRLGVGSIPCEQGYSLATMPALKTHC